MNWAGQEYTARKENGAASRLGRGRNRISNRLSILGLPVRYRTVVTNIVVRGRLNLVFRAYSVACRQRNGTQKYSEKHDRVEPSMPKRIDKTAKANRSAPARFSHRRFIRAQGSQR